MRASLSDFNKIIKVTGRRKKKKKGAKNIQYTGIDVEKCFLFKETCNDVVFFRFVIHNKIELFEEKKGTNVDEK